MSIKSNQSLLGVILVIAGIYAFIQRFFHLSFGSMPILVVGGALLLLYHTKRKVWALIMGSLFVFFGLVGSMPSFSAIGGHLIGAMVFLLPGFIFMMLYFTKRIIGFLIPGSILLWFGAFVAVSVLPFPGSVIGSLFFGFLGMAFVTMYVLGQRSIGKWPLIPGGILIAFGILILGVTSMGTLLTIIPTVTPIVLVAIGVIIVIKGMRKQ